jgi:lipopolysaccharide/colanic/teichoic acid biosynthesis glycosyltransferase
VAGLVCVAASPFHFCLCLLIRLWDAGPALYRSERLGSDGVLFQLLKYRTMKVDSAPVLAQGFKVIVEEGDLRVTGFGRLLRCGLDELPQLWNIVRGEMAWVGPRPDLPWMLPCYGRLTRERLSSLPGITGLAQVLNSRDCPTATGYALDIWYKRHRSFWLDLWIVMVTPTFILGWRSLGSRRLGKLMESTEIRELVARCKEEIDAAAQAIDRRRTPATASRDVSG